MAHWTISRIAEAAGVNVDTVRYYEKRGLLPMPRRTDGGYRIYEPDHLVHLRFIRRAQALGFTLSEIGELLALRADPKARDEVRAKTDEKVQEIDARIDDLRRIRAKLIDLADACESGRADHRCRVLDALDDGAAD